MKVDYYDVLVDMYHLRGTGFRWTPILISYSEARAELILAGYSEDEAAEYLGLLRADKGQQ